MAIVQVEAEVVLAVIEAVHFCVPANLDKVVEYCSFERSECSKGLNVATALGFLAEAGGVYTSTSPAVRYIAVSNGELRRGLFHIECMKIPWLAHFYNLIKAGTSPLDAARKVRVSYSLAGTDSGIRDCACRVLLYTGDFVYDAKGSYSAKPQVRAFEDNPEVITDIVGGTQYVRNMLNEHALLALPVEEVEKLGDAYVKGLKGDALGAVQAACRVVERILDLELTAIGLALNGGIDTKARDLRSATPPMITAKMMGYFSYLGQMRNAADHPADTEISPSAWSFDNLSALVIVNVCVLCLNAMYSQRNGVMTL
jgi:hypothetical protein